MPPDLSKKNFEATIKQVLTQAIPAPGPLDREAGQGTVRGGSFTGLTVYCCPRCRWNGVSPERIALCRYHEPESGR
ncbi:MAG TPA: hypothetical protein VJY33_05660 [Isosphaeraceae bacterium]|nr:hypothetical protein [Isosphaeraceae bacterium]